MIYLKLYISHQPYAFWTSFVAGESILNLHQLNYINKVNMCSHIMLQSPQQMMLWLWISHQCQLWQEEAKHTPDIKKKTIEVIDLIWFLHFISKIVWFVIDLPGQAEPPCRLVPYKAQVFTRGHLLYLCEMPRGVKKMGELNETGLKYNVNNSKAYWL